MDFKNIKLDKSTLLAFVFVGVSIIVLIAVRKPGKQVKESVPEAQNAEAITVTDGNVTELNDSKREAYEAVVRKNSAMGNSTGSADDLWASYTSVASVVGNDSIAQTPVSSVEQVFNISALTAQQQASSATYSNPAPAPKPKPASKPAPKPEPVIEDKPAEPAPVEEPVQEQVAPLQVKKSSVIGTTSKRGVISSLGGQVSERNIEDNDNHLIKCIFIRDQKVKSGDRVTLRLLEDILVDGNLIPANSHLTATCSISDRLQLTVSTVALNGSIYYTNLEAYDSDGSHGLYCPNSQTELERNASQSGRTVAGTAASTATRRAGSLVSSAVLSGVNAVTSSGNTNTSVFVPSGYQFYLLKTKKQ